MSDTISPTRVTLRIPGAWAHPGELVERMPDGFRLGPESLRMPDGTEIELNPRPADKQFSGIFQSACRKPPTSDELAILRRYTVNICLSGPGGSLEAALTMMRAAASIVRAGAAGVFIDNSAQACGGRDWLMMTDDGGPEAISFAFVSIIRSHRDLTTMGMQVMGFPDLKLRSSDVDQRGELVIELIRYICGGDRPIDVGHILADDLGRPRFHVVAREQDDFEEDSPMHNPHGRLKLVSSRDLAQGN